MPKTYAETLRIYWRHAWRYKRYVLGLLLFLPFLIVIHQVIPPLIAANVLDRLSSGDFTTGDVWGSFGSDLVWYAILIISASTIGWRIVVYLVWKLEINVLRDLIRYVFDHLATLDMNFHNDSFGGSLVSRSNKFISSYIRIADTFIFEIYGLIVMSIVTGIVLWPRAPQFVIAFYIVVISFVIVTTIVTRKIRYLSSIEANKQNKVTGYLADMITNVLAVKSFAGKKFENLRFAGATKEVEDASNKVLWAQLHRDNAFALFTSTLGALALIIATTVVVDLDAEIGTVFLVYVYTTNMTTRLWDFSHRALRNLNKAFGDAQEATEMLMRAPEITDPSTPKILPSSKGVIDLDNVDFSHDHNTLFENFNLHIKNGEKIGLVGHSGSGKTTLTKLLLRFNDIQDGSLKINNVDIRDVKQDDLRQVISYVPQEPLLFHRSLTENIAYGKPKATNTEIESASKNGYAHEFIKDLPEGYDTLVGERGVKLSGGQKQRVAIARAMLKDAPILVLDEATSALDSESEVLIQKALWKLMEGKTAIVIAHRLSTIQKMDRIIVLDKGKIVEEGKHEELIKKKNGVYARLWQHQSGGFLQE